MQNGRLAGNIGGTNLNHVRFDFLLVISFGVVSVILIVFGLISLLEGLDRGLSVLLIVCGVGFIIATFGLVQEFGFMEKWWF